MNIKREAQRDMQDREYNLDTMSEGFDSLEMTGGFPPEPTPHGAQETAQVWDVCPGPCPSHDLYMPHPSDDPLDPLNPF